MAYFRGFLPLWPEDETLMSSCDREMTDSRSHMVWLRPENASNVVVPGRGHLVSAFPDVTAVFRSDMRGSSYARKCLKNLVSFTSASEMMRVFNAR